MIVIDGDDYSEDRPKYLLQTADGWARKYSADELDDEHIGGDCNHTMMTVTVTVVLLMCTLCPMSASSR